jgi:hypothetical protein
MPHCRSVARGGVSERCHAATSTRHSDSEATLPHTVRCGRVAVRLPRGIVIIAPSHPIMIPDRIHACISIHPWI